MVKNPNKTVKITVYAEDRKKLKELAARRGETMSETFSGLVDHYLTWVKSKEK